MSEPARPPGKLVSQLQTADLIRQSTCSFNQFSKLQGLDLCDLVRYEVYGPAASIAKDKSIAGLAIRQTGLRHEVLDSH